MAIASEEGAPIKKTVPREWFKEWFNSPYYHKLYFRRDEAEAAGFIAALLQLLQPPPDSRLLDVACGRGRHARALAEHGYDVTGIDLAPDSIAYARQFENDHLHFYVHDMRRLFCTNCFQYAFNFFTSFGYFATFRENNNAIRTISSALQPHGVFVLDYGNMRYAEKCIVPHEQKIIDGTTFDITRWCDKKHFYKKIVVNEAGLARPHEFTERVAMFTPEDFASLFLPNGLHIRQLYGNYQLEPFHRDNSPRLIIIAEKCPA